MSNTCEDDVETDSVVNTHSDTIATDANDVPATVREKAKRKAHSKSEGKTISRQRKKILQSPPDRSKMTMLDLIHHNPSENPMVYEKPEDRNCIPDAETSQNSEEADQSTVGDTEDVTPGPRLILGPNGGITIDEESLVIERRVEHSTEVFEESSATYSSFREQISRRGWSKKETALFYAALSICGTDFTLMSERFFRDRNRGELKRKYKLEERKNRSLIDTALSQPQNFDRSLFENNSFMDDEVDDIEGKKSKSAKSTLSTTAGQKRIRRRRKKKKKQNFDDSDVDASDSVDEPSASAKQEDTENNSTTDLDRPDEIVEIISSDLYESNTNLECGMLDNVEYVTVVETTEAEMCDS